MTVEVLSNDKLEIHYRQTIAPSSARGSFTADDADNHDYVIPSRGKSKLNLTMNNPADTAITWTLYGMNDEDGAIGDPDVVQLDTDAILAATKVTEGFVNYAFPFFLLRLAYGGVPGDVPKKTMSVFANLVL
ncbi:MAG: hypothetical protein M0R06_12450 [Sphaerochaeta sp.]|jgi:hypothetical protein|nr:hypothetical protein [Sphaerochaeta sp.]